MPGWGWWPMAVLVSGTAKLYPAFQGAKPADNRPQQQTMSRTFGTCGPSDMAGLGLSHLGTLCPGWGASCLRVSPQKRCWAQLPQDGLGQYPGQQRVSPGAYQLHCSPHRPLHAFHGPPAWSAITQTTPPSLPGQEAVLEQQTPSLVSCKGASLLVQRYHSTPSTSGLTWLWQSVLILQCCIGELESLCLPRAFQMMADLLHSISTACTMGKWPQVAWGGISITIWLVSPITSTALKNS